MRLGVTGMRLSLRRREREQRDEHRRPREA
jgi:hypothetical protein